GLARHHSLEVRDLVAPGNLPGSRDPRLHIEPRVVVLLVEGHFGGQRRPRAHQGHLSTHYIDELRQLVNARAPQPAAEPRDAGIPRHLKQTGITVKAAGQQLIAALLCPVAHRPELDDPESAPTLP